MARRFAPIGRGLNQDRSAALADNDILQYDLATNKWQYVSAPLFDNVTVTGVAPQFIHYETDGPTDEKYWYTGANVGLWTVSAVNDVLGSSTIAIQIARTGITIDQIDLNATIVAISDGLELIGSGRRLIELRDTGSAAGSSLDLLEGSAGWGVSGSGGFRLDYDSTANEFTITGGAGTSLVTAVTIDRGGSAINLHSLNLTTDNDDASEVGYKGYPLNAQTGDYTLLLTDCSKCIRYNGAGGHSFTVPPNSSVAYPNGTKIKFMNITAATNVTIARGSGVSIVGAAAASKDWTLAGRSMCEIVKYTTDGWTLMGDAT